MGTRKHPGEFDCYAKALNDEPIFVLLGRDPDFPRLVHDWATKREQQIRFGDRPKSDMAMVEEARTAAEEARTWRKLNDGKWRK